MAPPYMTVNEFGGYMFLFIMCFALILCSIALILDGWDDQIAFIVFSVFGVGLALSIYVIVKEPREGE